MSYALGIKAIRSLCGEQDPLAWQRAKLSPALFKPYEQPVFEFVSKHLKQHHALPQVDTLIAQFPDVVGPTEVVEPSSYYVSLLENQYYYERINKANLDAQTLLKENQNAHEQALKILKQCTKDITEQKYRLRILDVSQDAPALLLNAYHKNYIHNEIVAGFGWPYMDDQFGGAVSGDVASFVGRPAAGKTWLTLWTALANWTNKQNVLFVSMEMRTLPIAQRLAALYTHQPIQQLKTSGFSSQTVQKFYAGLKKLVKEEAKFYIVDGNLAASVDDLFILADMLECRVVVIDGAYLLRHPNPRLDRFTRAAENVELIKNRCTDQNMVSFCSWQFNREASKKQKKGQGEQGDLEDIGYTDAISQISSIVLALFQEESIETMKSRKIRVLKGRNGEVGQFTIDWDFMGMSFQQVDPSTSSPSEAAEHAQELQWI